MNKLETRFNTKTIALFAEAKDPILKQVIITNSDVFDQIVEELLHRFAYEDHQVKGENNWHLHHKSFLDAYSFLVHNCTIDIKNE